MGERAWGLQFHLEATEGIVATMAAGGAGELVAAGSSPEVLLAPMGQHLADYQALARGVFQAWARLLRR